MIHRGRGDRHHDRPAAGAAHRVRLGALACAAVTAAGVTAAGVAAGPTTWSAAAKKPSPKAGVIAVDGPMTGAQASTGIDMARGAKLAVKEINAHGGIHGVKLRLVRVDDRATAKGALAAAHKAIADHAFAVVGPFNSSVGVVNLPVYKSAGLPIVRLTSSLTTEGYGVTVQPMASQVAPVDIHEIATVLGATRPAIIYDDSTYTAGIASQVASGLTADGTPPVADASVPTGGPVTAALAQVTAAHPNLLYIAAYGTDAGTIARDASTMNLGTCFVDLAAQGPDFVQAATDPVAQHCLSSGVPSAQQFAGARGYVRKYRAAYHTQPGTWGTFTYDSVDLLAHAVKKAGWKQRAVTRTMLHTKGYRGITGTISIDPHNGNRVQDTVVVLDVNASGNYVIDPTWAAATGFPLPSG